MSCNFDELNHIKNIQHVENYLHSEINYLNNLYDDISDKNMLKNAWKDWNMQWYLSYILRIIHKSQDLGTADCYLTTFDNLTLGVKNNDESRILSEMAYNLVLNKIQQDKEFRIQTMYAIVRQTKDIILYRKRNSDKLVSNFSVKRGADPISEIAAV